MSLKSDTEDYDPTGEIEKLANVSTNGDKATAVPAKPQEPPQPSAATRVLRVARKMQGDGELDLFHSDMRVPWATFKVKGHYETHEIAARQFKSFLTRLIKGVLPRTATDQVKQELIAELDEEAREEELHIRVASSPTDIYLDTGDDEWRVIHITEDGYEIIPGHEAPVKFMRTPRVAPLPVPKGGGDLNDLRDHINASKDDLVFCIAWVLGLLQPTGTYSGLAVHGEPGTAKTTSVTRLRMLVDPSRLATAAKPKDDRALHVAAENGFTIAYDNLSHLEDWLSDGLCRLASGAGFAPRTLYENTDETLFFGKRPVIFNGIVNVAYRGDLLDRVTPVELVPMDHRSEEELDAEWEEAHPYLLGAVLEAASVGLKWFAETETPDGIRLADYARWIEACSSSLGWEEGEFSAAFRDKRAESMEVEIEASPWAPKLIDLVDENDGEWTGTSTELLRILTKNVDKNEKGYPKTAQGMTGQLTRMGRALRRQGIHWEQRKDGKRTKRIWREGGIDED